MENDMLNVFFQGIFQFANIIEEKKIIYLAEKKYVGNEYLYCTYDENDEDYKEDYKKGFVIVAFYEPFVKEDMILYFENKVFYKELIDFLKQHMDVSNKILELDEYLIKIKNDLKV